MRGVNPAVIDAATECIGGKAHWGVPSRGLYGWAASSPLLSPCTRDLRPAHH